MTITTNQRDWEGFLRAHGETLLRYDLEVYRQGWWRVRGPICHFIFKEHQLVIRTRWTAWTEQVNMPMQHALWQPDPRVDATTFSLDLRVIPGRVATPLPTPTHKDWQLEPLAGYVTRFCAQQLHPSLVAGL